MDTRNDYLFALQLQNEYNKIESLFTDDIDRPNNYIDLTNSNSAISSGVLVKLTDQEVKNKKKKKGYRDKEFCDNS